LFDELSRIPTQDELLKVREVEFDILCASQGERIRIPEWCIELNGKGN
jgi:hypothetical protein